MKQIISAIVLALVVMFATMFYCKSNCAPLEYVPGVEAANPAE